LLRVYTIRFDYWNVSQRRSTKRAYSYYFTHRATDDAKRATYAMYDKMTCRCRSTEINDVTTRAST